MELTARTAATHALVAEFISHDRGTPSAAPHILESLTAGELRLALEATYRLTWLLDQKLAIQLLPPG